MKIINAGNAPLTLEIVRAATTGYKLAKCKTHPAQWVAFENLAIYVSEVTIQQLAVEGRLPDLAAPPPRTIAGVPVELDLDFPMTQMQFLDEAGAVVTAIECLPIPSGFWPSAEGCA